MTKLSWDDLFDIKNALEAIHSVGYEDADLAKYGKLVKKVEKVMKEMKKVKA